MYAEYYKKIIYPLQDRVIEAFKDSPFYLTGGTALSRVYYHHRYSDDLDYFLNDHPDFITISERCINKLSKIFQDVKVVISNDRFYRIFLSERRLKIELVNDVPAHFGSLTEHPKFGLIDSKENILANKITAVIDRCMPKDILDMYFLIKDGISLKETLININSKAAGIVPIYLAKIIAEFDYSLLDTEIKWINPLSSEEIKKFMSALSIAIIKGSVQ